MAPLPVKVAKYFFVELQNYLKYVPLTKTPTTFQLRFFLEIGMPSRWKVSNKSGHPYVLHEMSL